jgi:putative ABC transport system permease protein
MTGLVARPRRPWVLLRIAWRNVCRHWRHSLGSMLSIAVGFVAIALFQGYLADLEGLQASWNGQRSMLGSVIIERPGASSNEGRQNPVAYLLTGADQAFVDGFLAQHVSEVVARVRVLQVTGLASAGRTSVLFGGWGHDVVDGARMRGPWAWNAVAGRPLHLATPESVLLAGRLGRLLGCQAVGDSRAVGTGGGLTAVERPFTCGQARLQLAATTVGGQLNTIEPEVAGLFDAGLGELDARFLLMPLPLAQQLLDTDRVSFYTVALVGDVAGARSFALGFTRAAQACGLNLAATPWREHAFGELYRRTMDMLQVYRGLVVLVVVAIAGTSVFTTMLKAVNERIREIGTLRSLGFRRRQIMALFTLEGGLLAVVSCGVGLGLAAVATGAINLAGFTYSAGLTSQPIPLTVSLLPDVVLAASSFLVSVAVVASFLPARRAALLAIADALGHT